jgi:hypothetical protein
VSRLDACYRNVGSDVCHAQGQVTVIVDPENSLGLDVGAPATLTATWDTG